MPNYDEIFKKLCPKGNAEIFNADSLGPGPSPVKDIPFFIATPRMVKRQEISSTKQPANAFDIDKLWNRQSELGGIGKAILHGACGDFWRQWGGIEMPPILLDEIEFGFVLFWVAVRVVIDDVCDGKLGNTWCRVCQINHTRGLRRGRFFRRESQPSHSFFQVQMVVLTALLSWHGNNIPIGFGVWADIPVGFDLIRFHDGSVVLENHLRAVPHLCSR